MTRTSARIPRLARERETTHRKRAHVDGQPFMSLHESRRVLLLAKVIQARHLELGVGIRILLPSTRALDARVRVRHGALEHFGECAIRSRRRLTTFARVRSAVDAASRARASADDGERVARRRERESSAMAFAAREEPRRCVERWLLWMVHVFFVTRAIARAGVDRAFRTVGWSRFEPRRGLRHAWRAARAEMARRWRDGWARYDGGAKPTRAPRTLAVIVAMDEDACGLETCVRRVSEIVEWCSRRGVERTSVYDGTGRMRDGAGREALERALRKRSEEEAFKYVLRACDETQGGVVREVGRGGRAGDRGTMEVDALGGRDACAALVDAARRADLDDDSEESEDESESGGKRFAYKDKVRELERWMRDEGTFLPPADVVVVFGPTFHLDGYPPWQLHAAELFHEESLERFSHDDFTRIIDKYLTTAQRFGK